VLPLLRPLLRPALACALLGALLAGAPRAAHAAWEPPGVDLARPRLLFRPGDGAAIRARLAREPYRSWLARVEAQLASSRGWALDDHSIPAEREKAKAAKHAAFLYAIDRTLVAGAPAPFASPAARQALGDRARDLLLAMYGRSRIPAQFDDDINSSEEMIGYATAYDLLAGAGYDFGPDEPAIRQKLIDFASEFYLHFKFPERLTSDPFTSTDKLVNNHLSKSASALGVAAIALAEHTPAPGSDPDGVGDPAEWMAWGLERLDLVLRFTFVAGDGGYAEGPYYARYAAQNHLPFLRALDRLVGPAPLLARGGVVVPNLWRHPLFERLQRWLVDTTLPDGTLAPIDDGNPGKSYYFALLSHLADAPLHHWMAARTATPFESEGSIDLSADMICGYDDGIAAAPPPDGEARFHPEGGTVVFRSDWGRDAVLAIASAEHGTALELGRERDGRGQTGSASHEHNEPGAFLLHAFGERLALDPGYLSFPQRDLVARPEHHSIVLVDGQTPKDPFIASVVWAFGPGGLFGPPPVDGEASLTGPLDTDFVDGARVVARYGAAGARLDRRFLFPDHRYLVVADALRAADGASHAYTWLLHGNGGGTSGGSFDPLALGGRWTIGGARLDGVFDAAGDAPPSFDVALSNHEPTNGVLRTHSVLRAGVPGAHPRSVLLAYPTRSSEAPPASQRVDVRGGAGVLLADTAGDRLVLAGHRAPGAWRTLDLDAPGLRRATTDGDAFVFDAHADGRLRLALAEDASLLAYDGTTLLRARSYGRLGLRADATRADVVAENGDPEVAVGGLAFPPRAADGACALDPTGALPRVRLGRERRFTLRADGGNSAPAADPGPPRTAAPGAAVVVDAGASCDLDGDALTARWEIASAPAGSAWRLDGPGATQAVLHTDVAGPFRLRLVVTDAHGAASRPAELVVVAGAPCANGLDDDLDGGFDAADPSCAAGGGAGECGLVGIEAVPFAALFLALRARGRRRLARRRAAEGSCTR
jgi:hypothetical protein